MQASCTEKAYRLKTIPCVFIHVSLQYLEELSLLSHVSEKNPFKSFCIGIQFIFCTSLAINQARDFTSVAHQDLFLLGSYSSVYPLSQIVYSKP